ncbi:MAG: hypothetical protein KatS3mg102_0278 [Planctomycetota bacterium]|nr:MAG: hypothetical protein KatS3mg102_0278 [Planctomycetota bacterium]
MQAVTPSGSVSSLERARELVRRIEHAVQTGARRLPEEELAALARGYAELCTLVCERLQRCQQFALAGLVSEAIALCECAPDGLELLAALDTPSFGSWCAICTEYGLAVPPALPLEAAELLHHAYAEHQQIAPLLDAQRQLALGRAPLRRRLALLRRLLARVSQSDPWYPVLEEYEQARLQQIAHALQQAEAANDLETLRQLADELGAEPWQDRLHAPLAEQARQAIQRVSAARAGAELQALLPALERACAAGDLDAALALRSRWDELAGQTAVPAELAARARSRFAWAEQAAAAREQQRRFEQACEALRMGIENAAPRADLEELYREASSSGLALPAALEQSYRQQLERHARLRHRERRRRAIAALLALGLLAASAIWLTQLLLRRHSLQRVRQELAAALGQDRLEEASALWQALVKRDPDLAVEPELAPLRARLEQAQQAETARRQRFEEACEQARQALAGGQVPQAAGALERARASTRTPLEHQRLAALAQQLALAAQRQQAEQQAAFAAALRSLQDEVAALDPAATERDMAGFAHRLAALERRHAELAARTDLEAAARAGLEPIRLRLAQLREACEQLQRRREAERAARLAWRLLPAAADRVERYLEALRALCERYPDTEPAGVLLQVLAHAEAWRAAEAWFDAVAPWAALPAPPPAGAARECAEALHAYLERHPGGPWAEQARTIAAYYDRLAAIAARRFERFAAVRELLNLPLIASTRVIIDRASGKRYLLPPDARPVEFGDFVSVPVLRTTDLRRSERVRLPKAQIEGPHPSPQAELALQLHRVLDAYRPAQEPTFWLRFAQQIAGAEQVDPVLRAALLARILPYAAEDTWGAERQIAEWVAALAQRQVVDWPDPDDVEAEFERRRMQSALSGLDFAGALARARAAQQQVLELVESSFVRVLGRGVLMRAPDRTAWTLAGGPDPLPAGARLLAVVQEQQGPRAVWLGAVAAEGRRLQTPPPPPLTEGWLLFLCAAPVEQQR